MPLLTNLRMSPELLQLLCGYASCAQLQRSASEQATVRRVANQRFLTAMLEMGFRKDHAELALAETGNVGVEACPCCCPVSIIVGGQPNKTGLGRHGPTHIVSAPLGLLDVAMRDERPPL